MNLKQLIVSALQQQLPVISVRNGPFTRLGCVEILDLLLE